MLWEKKVEQWSAAVRARANLPARLTLWDGKSYDFGDFSGPAVTLHVKSPSALSLMLEPTLANLGEAYVQSKIDIEGKLSDIIDIAYALAKSSLDSGTGAGASALKSMARYFTHTKASDRKSIQYHYDVSNAFYQLWLDPNMVYSCAYFENGDEDLETAQLKKIDHILTKIQLQPGQTLLDIGCGWGALVIRAAQKFGAKCVGITLSQNQYALAKERVERAGLAGQVEIRLQDYRDVTGTFDRITSVGMFEHVGIKNLPLYFKQINNLLADGGMVMNHGITTTDIDNGESPYGAGEFIDKYVFPAGELPHISVVLKTMQEGGLEAFDVENLRRHYAKTCSMWADNFEANTEAIRKVTDEKHYRIWRVYLAGSAYGFERDWISLYQVVCTKTNTSAQGLPWSRNYIYGQ